MPGLQRVGVSRKIDDEGVRRKLRQAMRDLTPPEGLGFIIRTAGIDRSRSDLQRDMHYLLRLWKTIVRRIKKHPAPIDIYEESDMITRTIRDIYNADIETIRIDEAAACERTREFMKVVLPKHVETVQLYDGKEPMFHKYRIEEEIARIQERHVPLPGGGSLVIDQTEALVAIDVNSGSFRVDNNAEETAYQVNLARRRRDRPADSPARSGRGDRQRLHRHARGAAPPRRRTQAARLHRARPCRGRRCSASARSA